MFYQSRKFWLGTLDLVVSLILLFFSVQYPSFLTTAKTIIYALQPLVVTLIISWTIDDTLKQQLNLLPSFVSSRKFWLGALDIVVSFILLFVSVQFPVYRGVAQTLIVAIQPFIVAIIIANTTDDTIRAFATYFPNARDNVK